MERDGSSEAWAGGELGFTGLVRAAGSELPTAHPLLPDKKRDLVGGGMFIIFIL